MPLVEPRADWNRPASRANLRGVSIRATRLHPHQACREWQKQGMASIVILKAGESSTHDLTKDESVIGRHPECDIQIDSNMVSRKHARILQDGGKFFVEDLGSGNGTTVNGQRITGKTPLAHDDRVKLGPILLRFLDQ